MISSPLLTIAIPTYNRSPLLDRGLANISDILLNNNLTNVVEVLIANNGSTDSTTSVLSKYPKFITYSHDVNRGYDFNVLSLYKRSSGKYVIFVSDDDLVDELGLIKLLELIKKGNYDCIITNFRGTINDKSVGGFDHIFSASQPCIMSDIKNSLPFYFISSFAIAKGLKMSHKLWLGTNAMQMDLALSCLTNESSLYYLKDCVTEQNDDFKSLSTVNQSMAKRWKIHFGFAMVKRKYQIKFHSIFPFYMELHALSTFFLEWLRSTQKFSDTIDFAITCYHWLRRNVYQIAN